MEILVTTMAFLSLAFASHAIYKRERAYLAAFAIGVGYFVFRAIEIYG